METMTDSFTVDSFGHEHFHGIRVGTGSVELLSSNVARAGRGVPLPPIAELPMGAYDGQCTLGDAPGEGGVHAGYRDCPLRG